jgi:hypothetical protein
MKPISLERNNMKLDTVKLVTGIVVSSGAASIVGHALKMTLPEHTKPVKKVALFIGGVALSGMLGKMAAKYAEDEIDESVSTYQTMKSEFTKVKEEMKKAKQNN